MVSKRVQVLIVVGLLLASAAWRAAPGKGVAKAIDDAKVKVAANVYAQMSMRRSNNEQYDIEDLALWSRHLFDAELDVAEDDNERLAVYEAQLKRTAELARTARAFAANGQAPESEALAAEYYRLEAESQLAKAKAGLR
ncbi:MAG TPA: hypothetical protein VNH11_15390 [Pirellulales bacterium]|nr:hypothetical protein [Pirellulales bacterium]